MTRSFALWYLVFNSENITATESFDYRSAYFT